MLARVTSIEKDPDDFTEWVCLAVYSRFGDFDHPSQEIVGHAKVDIGYFKLQGREPVVGDAATFNVTIVGGLQHAIQEGSDAQ